MFFKSVFLAKQNLDIKMNYLSPLEMLYKWEGAKPNEIYLSQPIDGVLHNWTWGEVGL